MDNLEQIAFQIISYAGEAKSLLFEALKDAREENFILAEDKVKQAESSILKAHESHFSLIQKEASGDKVQVSLLLMHAEDQLITVETIKSLTLELIEMNKKINSNS
ncbi:PTS lactose/cellobiose transporter subunit IIA [Haloimpatiens sp. FM7315]|uniref:PTS lactose/cellobiose transporter subunit IIA n=1 Tax=Haloimpatiens sp. FM7315 TaxID=3298609 RepID=UPI0035A332C0